MARTAIVTLCLGDKYLAFWERHCKTSWHDYAERHGLDLVRLTSPPDTSEQGSKRSPAWQKCLILETVTDYDRVVWLDADIVISPNAPSVVEGVAMGDVGAVISGSYLHPELKGAFLRRRRRRQIAPQDEQQAWRDDQAGFYRAAGVNCASSDIVQGGVLVLDSSHRQLLRRVYDSHPGELVCFEQLPLSAAILDAGLLHPLDSRFNMVFADRAVVHYPYLFDKAYRGNAELARLAVQTELANSYFLHFAGALELLPYASWRKAI